MEERLWHRSYVPGIPKEIKLEDITIPEILSRTAQKFPNRIALIFLGKKITYKELDRLANRFAHALVSLGLTPGRPDRAAAAQYPPDGHRLLRGVAGAGSFPSPSIRSIPTGRSSTSLPRRGQPPW